MFFVCLANVFYETRTKVALIRVQVGPHKNAVVVVFFTFVPSILFFIIQKFVDRIAYCGLIEAFKPPPSSSKESLPILLR